MAYAPINLQIYNASYCGAFAAMALSGRQITSVVPTDYTLETQLAGAFAEQFDIIWNDATTANGLQVLGALLDSYAYFQERDPSGQLSPIPANFDSSARPIIASILGAALYFASQGITPPPFGGGGGSTIPVPSAAGLLLTSTGTIAGAYDWEAAGGFKINSFTGITQRVRRGATVHNPVWAAGYSESPDSTSLSWTNPPGSQVLTPGQIAGTIVADFTSNVNGATSVATLRATRGATSGALSQAITFCSSVLYNPVGVDPNAITIDAAWIDANLTTEVLQTAPAGTYSESGISPDNVAVIARPSAFADGVWRNQSGLVQIPIVLGTVANWMNADGVTESQVLLQFGSAGAAASYTWSVS